MANGNRKDETKISPYFIAIAAGLLIILLAVLLVMSGILDHAFSGKSVEESPAAETAVTEVPSEAPESAATSPTPTENHQYREGRRDRPYYGHSRCGVFSGQHQHQRNTERILRLLRSDRDPYGYRDPH